MFRCTARRTLALVCAIACAAPLATTAAAGADGPPRLVQPNGLALDRDGNLFISDVGTHRIYKLDTAGRVTVIAGTGEGGFGGDGGPAMNAQLFSPSDLAIDGDGNLFIADTFNHRI